MRKRRTSAGEVRFGSTPPAHGETVDELGLQDEEIDADEQWEHKASRRWSEFERELDGGVQVEDEPRFDFDDEPYDPLKQFKLDPD